MQITTLLLSFAGTQSGIMTGQQTLQDVGVKRARTDDGSNNDSQATDGQPDPKKVHSASEGQHTSPAAAKENEGSKSNKQAEAGKPDPKPAASKPEQSKADTPKSTGKAKAGSKSEQDTGVAQQSTGQASNAGPKAKEDSNKDSDAKANAKQEPAPKEEADAKAEIPETSVPKPKGTLWLVD